MEKLDMHQREHDKEETSIFKELCTAQEPANNDKGHRFDSIR